MYIFLVSLLGFILRITNIVKPEGLWNDEYVSWFIASIPFGQGFCQEILKQCHMPLYYFYLKPFAQFGDTILRLTSVFPSVLAIPVMYLIGKEYSEKCAKYSAIITSVLPFLVYYSQEVRLYSLVFLISSLLLLYTIRTLKNPCKKNIILYFVFSFTLIFTHVLGIFFVILITVYLIYKKNLLSKRNLFFLFSGFILVFPFGLIILKQLPSAQWWGIFSYTNIMFLFSDFLSPILSNHINAPPVFYYKTGLDFIFLITVPTLFGIAGIILGFKKCRGLILTVLGYIFVLAVISCSGKLVFITKYLTEILPVIILAISLGFDGNNKLKQLILYAFVFINIIAVFFPVYPAKIFRIEGNRLPAVILNVQQPDRIIFTYYAPDRFERYLNTNAKLEYISKINRFDYIDNLKKILNDIKSGENVSIVFLDSVSFIPENRIEEAETRNFPEMFITFSKIRHLLEIYVESNFNDVFITKSGSWTILYGTKK